MKLISFSVKNYRSISKAYRLPLDDFTVIIGPNNEGKSNILKALALSLNVLTKSDRIRLRYGKILPRIYRRPDIISYDWEKDYPINLQSSDVDGESQFTLEFELSDEEFKEFKQKTKTKIKLKTNLTAEVFIGKGKIRKEFLMRGKRKQALNKKSDVITDFIKSKLLFQYIPSIRTSELTIDTVENLLAEELSTLEEDQQFKEVVKTIGKLRQPIIQEIEKNLKKSVSDFIPDIKTISIKSHEKISRLISSSCRVYIDDGINTDIEQKGDGVISLVAISLLQYISRRGSLGKGLIILLEEPETHLHPEAIHNLRKVLEEISTKNQVIATTHSPIMIDRRQVKHNIIVQKSKATPAKNLDEIRKLLGITLSDNLSSAYLVLLVEGESDIKILKTWLELMSDKVKDAIANGSLVLDSLDGAPNVSYKARLYKNILCNVMAFLDNDSSGKSSIKNAFKKGILKTSEYSLLSCKGMKDSEIEDLVNPSSYKEELLDEYDVDINNPAFKNSKAKWSDRIEKLFHNTGKLWDDEIKFKLKNLVSQAVVEKGLSSLDIHKTNSIDGLNVALEKILGKQ